MQAGCYLVAAALVLSGLVHLGILVVSGDSWSGPPSWRKPATFGLSFGLPSHFVPDGSPGPLLNGLVGAGAAAGAVVLVVTSVLLTVAAFGPGRDTPPNMRLAVRAGLASFLVALAVGGLMLARGLVLTRSGDVAAAFAGSGRRAHTGRSPQMR